MIFSALIWLITNFHHPVTPSHFTNLGMPNHIFGTSYAMMVFTSFLTAPIWGSWADRNSRMKVLFLSTLIYGIGQFGFGLSKSLWGILFFRGISGIANGGFSGGLMAAIVDTTTEENRGIAMSNYTAMMLVMASIGYLIGGLLGFLTPQYVIFIQAILMIIISFGFIFIVGETNLNTKPHSDKKVVFVWDIIRDAKKSKEVFNSWLIIFLCLTFFIYIAQSSNLNAFNYYLKEQLNMKPIVNGVWKTITGIVGLIANLTINVWIFRRKDILRSLVGLIAISIISATMIILNTSVYPFMIWNLIFYTMMTILIPILQNLAVEGHSENVGFMSGLYNAIRALGEVFGSTVAGFTYNLSSLAPFVLAAGSLVIALLLGLIGRGKQIGLKNNN
jgi:DHA1 family multidrug resistance protein-like MFS transporter